MKKLVFPFFIVILLVLLGLSVWSGVPHSQIKTHLDNYKLYDLVNNYRAANKLRKLSFDPELCAYAQVRLTDLRTDNSHTGFKNHPPSYSKNIRVVGENLANGYSDESDLLSAWIASPTHKANLLKPEYTRTCIVNTSYESIYVVQEFASY